MGKRYQSDLTDQQWAIIKPLIPTEKEGRRPRATDTGNKLIDWAVSFFGIVWKVVKRPRKIFKIVKFR